MSAEPVAELPPGVVTVMSTVPAEPEGAVATTELAESEVMLPAIDPNLTELAEARLAKAWLRNTPPEKARGLLAARAREADGGTMRFT